MQQHSRLRHAAQYNQAAEEKALKARGASSRWTPAEELMLAELELTLGKVPQVEINRQLAAKCGRSSEAVKARRKTASYKAALEEAKAEAMRKADSSDEALATPEPEVEEEQRGDSLDTPPSPPTPKPDGKGSGNQRPRTPPFLKLTPVDSACKLIPNASICTTLRSVYDSCTPQMAEIVKRTLNDSITREELDEALCKIVRDLGGSKPKPRKRQRKAKVQGRRKKRCPKQEARALQFKHLQEAYKKSPAIAAKMILGDKKATDSVPKEADVREFYKNLFGTPVDMPEPHRPRKLKKQAYLSEGISPAEIRKHLKGLNDSAPGPDGIMREHLRKAKLSDLVAIANLVFGARLIPSILRENRTTLLPKSGDLTNVANWRPVTISSLLLRLIHKVIAERLSKRCPLHKAQRGFTPQDGLMANTLMLDAIIKERRRKAQPLHILSIDLAKAFDKVCPQVIRRALIRKGVDDHMIEYISSIYEGVTTTISVGDITLEPMAVLRGVKQGDPTSGILFNLIIDELLEELEEKHGVLVGKVAEEPVRVAGMGFADDTVFLAESPEGMKRHIRKLEGWLVKNAMEVNVAKCNALQLMKVATAKKVAVVTKPMFQINGTEVKCLAVESQLKYLGLTYSHRGITPSPANLSEMLDKLKKAALKPWQKMSVLRTYLIPKLHYTLQSPAVTVKQLKFLDTQIRAFVKVLLHLPKTTPDAFFYAKMADGGLGLPQLSLFTFTVFRRRVLKLEEKGDKYVQAILGTQTMEKLAVKLDKGCKGVVAAAHYHKLQQRRLGETALGVGLAHACSGKGSSWILAPPVSWTGYDYVRAVQLRCGLLPTQGAPYIQDPKLAACRNTACKRRGIRESLYHVLQRCPITHWARIERHDAVCKVLESDLKKKGYRVYTEPRIRKEGRLYKPDLICISPDGKVGQIVEVSVAYENRGTLGLAHGIKRKTYEPIADEVKKEYGVQVVHVVPFIVGARGGEHPNNIKVLRHWGIDTRRATACICLKFGSSIHRQFMAAVWQAGP